jgi:hypothetical protein
VSEATEQDGEPIEGCPDCGSDTVEADELGDVCTRCGWRP